MTGEERAAVEAWRKRAPKPTFTDEEVRNAVAIRNRFRAAGFDLKLIEGGSVVVVDLTSARRPGHGVRVAPLPLTNTLWEHIEAIGALLDREAEQAPLGTAGGKESA